MIATIAIIYIIVGSWVNAMVTWLKASEWNAVHVMTSWVLCTLFGPILFLYDSLRINKLVAWVRKKLRK